MTAIQTLLAEFSFLENVPPPFNMVVLITLIICASTLIGAVAAEIRKFATHRQDVALKRELVDRGLSVEEVERIVRSSSNSREEHLS